MADKVPVKRTTEVRPFQRTSSCGRRAAGSRPRVRLDSAGTPSRRPALDYDADRAPDPSAWTAAPEDERLAAVEVHHRALSSAHPPTPKPRLHAAIHLVVENQLAAGAPPEARRALDRLVRGGLARHEAVHAIASVVADAAHGALSGGRFDPAQYARALDALTAEGWRARGTDG
jgi:hypothetical protein